MKPPVDAPTSSAASAARVDAEGVERGRELVPAAADVRLRLRDLERRGRIDGVAGLVVKARGIAIADPDLAGQDQRLGSGTRFHQAPLDEELVEADALRPGGRGRVAHVRIVAQRAHRGLNERWRVGAAAR